MQEVKVKCHEQCKQYCPQCTVAFFVGLCVYTADSLRVFAEHVCCNNSKCLMTDCSRGSRDRRQVEGGLTRVLSPSRVH